MSACYELDFTDGCTQFYNLLIKNVMKCLARFEDEMKLGRIGGVLRDRSVCKVDHSFFG